MPGWWSRRRGPSSDPSGAVAGSTHDEDLARAALVAKIAETRPWSDGPTWSPRVLAALMRVPRRAFAPSLAMPEAYADEPQAIGHGQTISQPTMVALMTQALVLTGKERVLEIGTGSGYQAAVLATLAAHVDTIERIPALFESARAVLHRVAPTNVEVHFGDGYLGLPLRAPFDRILLTAAPESIPRDLLSQLAEGGMLVAPVGKVGEDQRLLRIHRRDGSDFSEDLGAVRFVPML